MEELRTAPRQERSLRTIDSILDAAEALIAQRGQVSFTAHELAAAAGTSVGRVYYWFPDIPSVVAALGDRGSRRLAEHFAAVLDQSAVTIGNEFVPILIDMVVDFFVANPALTVLVLTGGTVEDHGQAIRSAVHQFAAGVHASRNPDLSDEERCLLGRLTTSVLVAAVREFAHDADLAPLRSELTALTAGWLGSRRRGAQGATPRAPRSR